MADLLRFAKCSAQFVLGPLKEPFLCQHEVDHSIASWHLVGWVRFQHLFATAPAYLLKHFSVPGTQILTLRVVHSTLRQMLVDKEDFDVGLSVLLLQCERCQSSQRDQDIVPKASVHPWVISVSFFVNRLPICPTLIHLLVCSFSNNLSQHLLLWHGVPYGVGWMVAFIIKLFLIIDNRGAELSN